MAIDLGTAYISVVPTTKDLDKGIRQALDGTVKHADKTGDAIGSRMATTITSHLAGSGGKSGDAFARSFSPKVQSAGASALQGLANLMIGSAQGIGSELGGGISSGMTGAINRGAVTAIDALTAVGVKGGNSMSSKLQSAGMLAAGGVALVTTAAVAATTELYKIGAAWDDISDGITSQTGLIGAELDKVTNSVKNVAAESAASPGDIAKVTAQLVQTLKLSGTDLEKLTRQISDYNDMNQDAPLNVREFAKAMKQYGITSAQEMSDTLDRLNNIAQNTGIPLNALIGSLKDAAPVAQQFNMPLAQVTQLLSTFEEAGLNAESAATLLKLALGNLAKDDPNANPVTALQGVITKIQELDRSGRTLEAIDLAKSTFGRSWDQILPLIQQNRLEVDNLNTSTKALGPTIEQQRQATEDFTEEWRKFKNFLTIELEPAAKLVFGGLNSLLQSTLGVAAQNLKDIRNFFGGGGDTPTGTSSIPGGIPGGGGPNAQRERRGASPTDPTGGLLGGGIPGTAGRGFFNSGSASAWIDGQLGGGTGQAQAAMPAGGGAEAWRPAVRNAIAQYGPQLGITNTKAWEDALVRQIQTESGGNPRADNPTDSNGKGGKQHVSGLLQFLPETFNSHNISGGAYLDPQAQIAAALHYVINRYGVDANGAPLQIGRGVGYRIGGAIHGPGTPTSDSIPAWLSTGEHVLTAADVTAMGGQAGVYAFRNALHRAGGGMVDWKLAGVPWEPRGDAGQGTGQVGQPTQDPNYKRPNPIQEKPGWGDLGPGLIPGKDAKVTGPDGSGYFEAPWWWWGVKPPPLSPERRNRRGVTGWSGGGPVLPLEDEPGWNPDTMGNKRRGPILEDQPGWNPDTMGNKRRGPLEDQPGWDWQTMGNRRRGHDYVLMGGNHIKGFAPGGAVDDNLLKQLQNQGVDPNTLIHGLGNGAPPGPQAPDAAPTNPDQPTNLDTTNRKAGFMPASAGNTGVAGTSSLSHLIGFGNEIVGGLIDTGANVAQTAISAAITAGIAAGTEGAGAAAGPAASAAAAYGIQTAAKIGKRLSAYGFQLAGIGADALVAQLFPFGPPRWLGYDYTAFMPTFSLGDLGITTGEKAANQAENPNGQPGQDAGGPVQPDLMPGVQQAIVQHQGTGAQPGPGAFPGTNPMSPDMSPAQPGAVTPPAAAGPAAQQPATPPPPAPPATPPVLPFNLFGNVMGYDQGGMLPPGGIGVNMTGRPEPVLTPQQWDSLTQTIPNPDGRGAPLVKIDAIYGMSPEDVANKIEAKQKLAMMRYAGRP